ncbi:MAG TPA: toxin-antitoxin system HicB family antitoxin [Acidimicrobiia bacterium]|nr:toxin-antitoxin system HicB family antitoxin [Acidimicrobiia bacterium]
MQLDQALLGLETAVETQLRVAGPEATELGAQLMAALQPAIRQTFLDVLCAAAAEVSSQLVGQKVEVKMVDGDPELVVTRDDSGTSARFDDDDDIDMSETCITVRLPSNLKEIIADAAQAAGDSLNAFVVDALKTQTRATRNVGKTRVRTTIDL